MSARKKVMAVEPRAEQPNVKIEDEIEDDKAGWIENFSYGRQLP